MMLIYKIKKITDAETSVSVNHDTRRNIPEDLSSYVRHVLIMSLLGQYLVSLYYRSPSLTFRRVCHLHIICYEVR